MKILNTNHIIYIFLKIIKISIFIYFFKIIFPLMKNQFVVANNNGGEVMKKNTRCLGLSGFRLIFIYHPINSYSD